MRNKILVKVVQNQICSFSRSFHDDDGKLFFQCFYYVGDGLNVPLTYNDRSRNRYFCNQTQNTITDIMHIPNLKLLPILNFNILLNVCIFFLRNAFEFVFLFISMKKLDFQFYTKPYLQGFDYKCISSFKFSDLIAFIKIFFIHYSFLCFKFKPHWGPILHQESYFISNTTQTQAYRTSCLGQCKKRFVEKQTFQIAEKKDRLSCFEIFSLHQLTDILPAK